MILTRTHTHDKRLAWNSTSHRCFLSLFRVLWSCWTKLCRSPWTLRLDCLSSSCWESPEKTDSSESCTVIITISGTVATAPWITAVRVQVYNTVAYSNLTLTNHKHSFNICSYCVLAGFILSPYTRAGYQYSVPLRYRPKQSSTILRY